MRSQLSSVVLVGPMSPAYVSDLLSTEDRNRAREIPGIGGVPVGDLARALIASGLDVEVVTTSVGIDDDVTLAGDHLRVLIAPHRDRARARDLFREERHGLERLLRDTQGSAINAHWTYEYAWAAQSVGGNRPLVVTAHDAPLAILRRMPSRYRLVRTALATVVRSRIRTLTVVSPYLARHWRRYFAYRRPILLTPNMAPTVPPAGTPAGLADASILAIGDDGPLKNMRTLVSAFALLRREVPRARLTLAGPGLGADEAFARETTPVARDGITFAGQLQHADLLPLYQSATVLVHPSLEEACPMVLLEAMAAGVAVVAGERAGGVPWVLAEGAGLLVDVSDPESVSDALARVLTQPALRASVVRSAHARVAEVFSPTPVVGTYLQAYDRAISHQRSGRRSRSEGTVAVD